MKKQYLTPEMEILKLEQEGMLCLSGDLGDDATDPAKARLFDGDLDDWDEE